MTSLSKIAIVMLFLVQDFETWYRASYNTLEDTPITIHGDMTTGELGTNAFETTKKK